MNKKVLSFFLVFFMVFQHFIPINVWADKNDFVITTVNGVQIGQKDNGKSTESRWVSIIKNNSSNEGYSHNLQIVKVNGLETQSNYFVNPVILEDSQQDGGLVKLSKDQYTRAATIPALNSYYPNSNIINESTKGIEIEYRLTQPADGTKIDEISVILYTVEREEEGYKLTKYNSNIPTPVGNKFRADHSDYSKELLAGVRIRVTKNGISRRETKWIGIINKKEEIVEEKTDYLNIQMNTNKNQYNSGEEFPLYINISPEDIDKNIIRPETTKKKVVILFDTSGSMIQNKIFGETRLDIAKESCNGFLNSLKQVQGVEVALIPFSTSAYETYKSKSEKLSIVFSNNINNVQGYLNNLRYYKNEEENYAFLGTNIGDALRIANSLFENLSQNEEKHLILFTDGFPTAFTTTNLNTTNYVNDDAMVSITNRYTQNNEWYYEGINGRHVKSYSGDRDKNNNALNYAVKMAGVTKALGVKSSVVGFTEGVNHNRLMKITNTLNGKYYMAKDSASLDKVFNEIKDETVNTITFTNIQVNINHEGFTIVESSHDRIVNGNITTIKIPNITLQLDSKNEKYIGADINSELKLKAKDVRIDTTRLVLGDMIYVDFKGNSCRSSDSKELKIKPKSTDTQNFIDIKMTSSKNEYRIGEEFYIESKISSNPIAVSGSNSKTKQIAILFDTSGSMDHKMTTAESSHYTSKECRLCKPQNNTGSIGEEKACNNHKNCYVWKCNEYEKTQRVWCYDCWGWEWKTTIEKRWGWTRKCDSNHGNKKTRIEVAKEQSKEFIDSFKDVNNVEFALIPFSNSARTKSNTVNNIFEREDNIKTRIDNLVANGGTNIGDALRVASHVFNEDADKYLILLTDGNPTYRSMSKDYHNNYYIKEKVINWKRNYYGYWYTDPKVSNPEFEIQGEGNADSYGYNLEYTKVASKMCKDKRINSYVIGFTDGIENNKLTQISNALGGNAYKANDENALQAIVNDISKTINETMKISTTVNIQLPPGIELSKDSGFTSIDGKVTVPVEIKYTLNSSKTQYEAIPEIFKIKLTSVRESGVPNLIKEFNGEVRYGNGEVSKDTLFIKISENTNIQPPKLIMNVPEKVICGSEFYVYNSIIPKDITKGQYAGNENKIVIKNVQLTIESKGNIKAINYENYGFDFIDDKYQKFIEEIVYVYHKASNSYKATEPIYIPFKFEAIRPGSGSITSYLTYDGYNGPQITQTATVGIDDFEKLSVTQTINKSNVDLEEDFTVEYVINSIPFKLDNSDSSKIIKDIELEIEIPNSVEVTSAQVINNKVKIANEVTFIKGEDGYYRSEQLESITINYKLLGGNTGDILTFGGNIKYKDFNNEQIKVVPLAKETVTVAFQAPDISLELQQGKTTGKLIVKNNDKFKCSVDIRDEEGNILYPQKLEIEANSGKKINIEKLPKGYIVVKGTRDHINYSQEKVPVIYIDEFKFDENYKLDGSDSYSRKETMSIIAPNESKIKAITISDKLNNMVYSEKPFDNIVSGGSYQQKGVKLVHGENKLQVEASFNKNITQYSEIRNIDAEPPIARITESENKKDLIITFPNESVKEDFTITIKDMNGEDIALSLNELSSIIIKIPETKKEYEKLGLIESIRGKTIEISNYKDLSNNFGEKVTHKISSNKEQDVYIVTDKIRVNGKNSSSNGTTIVKDLEVTIDVSLKVIYDKKLKIIVKSETDLDIYDAMLMNDSDKLVDETSINADTKNVIVIEKLFNNLNEGDTNFILRFRAKAPRNDSDNPNKQRKITISIEGEGLDSTKPLSTEVKLNILDANLE